MDKPIVRATYRQVAPILDTTYLAERARPTMSEGFRQYQNRTREIEKDRRLDGPLKRAEQRIGLIGEIIPFLANHDELGYVFGELLKLRAVPEAHVQIAQLVRKGRKVCPIKTTMHYFDHVKLYDEISRYSELYFPKRRRRIGSIVEEIEKGEDKQELRDLLTVETSLSARQELVIPRENLVRFRQIFERMYFGSDDRNGNGQSLLDQNLKPNSHKMPRLGGPEQI